MNEGKNTTIRCEDDQSILLKFRVPPVCFINFMCFVEWIERLTLSVSINGPNVTFNVIHIYDTRKKEEINEITNISIRHSWFLFNSFFLNSQYVIISRRLFSCWPLKIRSVQKDAVLWCSSLTCKHCIFLSIFFSIIWYGYLVFMWYVNDVFRDFFRLGLMVYICEFYGNFDT